MTIEGVKTLVKNHTSTFTCTATESNPPPSIYWTTVIGSTRYPVDTSNIKSDIISTGLGWRVISKAVINAPEAKDMTVECSAKEDAQGFTAQAIHEVIIHSKS